MEETVMMRKIEFGRPQAHEVFAEPTPMGLLGLAIGCAALVPIAFGHSLTPGGLHTAALFCLLFGAGGQFMAGVMNLANHNLYGGTLFTTFAFNWVFNWWTLDSLSRGVVPDALVVHAVEVCFLVIFVVFTYGFGFFSSLLFAFLLDIDLIYLCKVATAVTGSRVFDLPVALLTVALGLLSLWIAFALLINPTSGRVLFTLGKPMWRAPSRPGFDNSTRRAIFDVLYAEWRTHGFRQLPVDDLRAQVAAKAGDRDLAPDLEYLAELGGVTLLRRQPEEIAAARLTAAGIDFYEQVVLGKQQFA
jgi:succinate-acetate transporter protein